MTDRPDRSATRDAEIDAPPVDDLLLSTTPIQTFLGPTILTNATGFFFRRDEALFLVTSRHVLHDEAGEHHPDRIVIEIHIDPDNLTRCVDFSIPLYRDGGAVWIAGSDTSGDIDVAVIELDREAFPADAVYAAFTPDSLLGTEETVAIGSPMLIVGFPLGFHDTLHRLPIVRHAINASSFTMRFQGKGYFLTDARTHRGSSGAPVVRMDPDRGARGMPWLLLGVHSARMDISGRDDAVDEALGVNCAWFADILLTLTKPRA